MNDTKLKPCPFCGGEAYICETLGIWHIDCDHTKKCKIRPSTFLMGDSTIFKQIKAWNRRVTDAGHCVDVVMFDDLDYIKQLESSRWELFDDLSTAYYGKVMYGLNDDGTVYSRYSCDTMSFEQAVDEFRRLIADE